KGRCLCKIHRPIPPLHDVLFPRNHYANGFGLFLKYFCVSSLLCFISLKNPLLQFGVTNKRRNPKQRLENNRHCYRLLMLQMCDNSSTQIGYYNNVPKIPVLGIMKSISEMISITPIN